MPLRGEGLVDEGQQERKPEKTVYILHPNCAIEDM